MFIYFVNQAEAWSSSLRKHVGLEVGISYANKIDW